MYLKFSNGSLYAHKKRGRSMSVHTSTAVLPEYRDLSESNLSPGIENNREVSVLHVPVSSR
jgi:hypothetical protein